MRFISCQFEAYFENELWKKNAAHANQTAKYLYEELTTLHGVTPACETKCNSVFAALPQDMKKRMLEKYFFYDMDVSPGKQISRLMCSFNTQKEDIDALIALAKEK